ncbi:MAG TPA: hypothetical protein VMS99_08535, partial [Acidimicrobiia bacterium]|nr:hypothetical protein [Acidimicrobiia bacterium]
MADAVLTFISFRKGRTGLAWVGVFGLCGLAPLLVWFPLAGAIGPAAPDSLWARARSGGPRPDVASHPGTGTPSAQSTGAETVATAPTLPSVSPLTETQPSGVDVSEFLADAWYKGVIDEATYRRLVEMLRGQKGGAPLVAPTPRVEPPPFTPEPAPTPQQPEPTPSPAPVPTTPALTPPVLRRPTPATRTRSRLWHAVASDVALHGFSYLGVLLTFVAVLGFLLFSFADLPDAAQPFVELIIALIFFGWAWFLRRQDAVRVADGMELIGGMVLPLILFASLVDNAPFPPDFEDGALVAALSVSAVLLSAAYWMYTSRRPQSVLRYLVGPLLWLGALTLGFAFKTDEPLVGDAITRLVSPQPAIASVAIALSLLVCLRRPQHRLAGPTVTAALFGLPVAYLITVSLAFGEGWARSWPIVALGAGTLISAEVVARWYHKETWVAVMRPLLLAGVLAPLAPALPLGWAGLIVAVSYMALFELDRRLSSPSWLGQLLSGVGVVIGALITLSEAWSALVVFTLLSVWAHFRRFTTPEPEGAAQLFTIAAAVFPVGIGYALLELIDPGVAWLAMAGVLAVGAVVTRRLQIEDGFWPLWLGATSLVVAFGAWTGWNQGLGDEVFGAPAVAVAAVVIALLPRRPILRLWVAAALLSIAAAMALSTADLPFDQRAVAWAGLGFALVLVANLVRRTPASHLAAVGHLIAADPLLALPSGPARSVVVGGFALGWVASTVGGELGGDSLTALLQRLTARIDEGEDTQLTAARWVAPVMMTASVPVAVITVANLWQVVAARLEWSGVVLGLIAVVYAGVARIVISRRPLSRVLATGAVVASIVGSALALALPDSSWPAIFASAAMIVVAVLLDRELRQSWFVWVTWVVSVILVGRIGEQAGVPDAWLSRLTLVWGTVMVVGGLAIDDVLSTRRRPGEGIRIRWLRYPVYVGAIVVPLTMVDVFFLPPAIYGWWAIGVAGVCFAAAYLLRVGAVTALGFALLAVALTALSPRSLLDEPWLYVVPAAVLIALSWVLARFQSSEIADDDLLRWDLAPLVVAHLIAGFALSVAFENGTVAPTALAVGALSLVVGGWRRGRVWIEVGHLLILIAAFDVGQGWLALVLAATSIRGAIGGWRTEDGERLTHQLIGAFSAALAWITLVDWQELPSVEAVTYSSVVFAGLALGLGIASRIWEVRQDTMAVWGGLAVLGVLQSGAVAVSLDEGHLGPWMAIGFATLAIVFELAWPRIGPTLRVFTVVAAGLTWLSLIPGVGWGRSTAVILTSLLFGLLAVVVAELSRWRAARDQGELQDGDLLVARAWLGLAVAGVLIAALAYRGDSVGYAIASGLVLLSIGLARGASPLRIGLLRESSAITSLLAVNLAADTADLSQTVIAIAVILLAVGATLSSLWLWRRQRAAFWITPLVVLAAAANVETVYFAIQALPDRAMVVAVLLSIGSQAVALGVTRSMPGALAVGPPAAALAFVLSVGESVSGSAQWYTVPIALVILAEVEILRATRRAAGADQGEDAIVLEWVGIGLLVAPALVEMFTSSLV